MGFEDNEMNLRGSLIKFLILFFSFLFVSAITLAMGNITASVEWLLRHKQLFFLLI
jgi:hypothetical protein